MPERINAMREYLDALGQEYAAGYLRAARQQRLDEAWLNDKMKAANDGKGPPELPEWLAKPTTAWLMLTDPSKFPRLGALMDDAAFPIDTFRTNYKLAKECLEMHAGFGDPPIESRVYRAGKLATRATTFADLHVKPLGHLKEPVEESARQVEEACSRQDPAEIQKRTVQLSRLTAQAVARVYPEPKSSAAADGSAAVTSEIEAHPAAPPP